MACGLIAKVIRDKKGYDNISAYVFIIMLE